MSLAHQFHPNALNALHTATACLTSVLKGIAIPHAHPFASGNVRGSLAFEGDAAKHVPIRKLVVVLNDPHRPLSHPFDLVLRFQFLFVEVLFAHTSHVKSRSGYTGRNWPRTPLLQALHNAVRGDSPQPATKAMRASVMLKPLNRSHHANWQLTPSLPFEQGDHIERCRI